MRVALLNININVLHVEEIGICVMVAVDLVHIIMSAQKY